jgi:hypothetical protein
MKKRPRAVSPRREGYSFDLEQDAPVNCPLYSTQVNRRGPIMFVVRIKRPKEDFDYKTFRSEKDAVARFRTAQREMIDGGIEQCALFDAEAPGAESAVAMVCRGKADLVASDLSDEPNTPARTT